MSECRSVPGRRRFVTLRPALGSRRSRSQLAAADTATRRVTREGGVTDIRDTDVVTWGLRDNADLPAGRRSAAAR